MEKGLYVSPVDRGDLECTLTDSCFSFSLVLRNCAVCVAFNHEIPTLARPAFVVYQRKNYKKAKKWNVYTVDAAAVLVVTKCEKKYSTCSYIFNHIIKEQSMNIKVMTIDSLFLDHEVVDTQRKRKANTYSDQSLDALHQHPVSQSPIVFRYQQNGALPMRLERYPRLWTIASVPWTADRSEHRARWLDELLQRGHQVTRLQSHACKTGGDVHWMVVSGSRSEYRRLQHDDENLWKRNHWGNHRRQTGCCTDHGPETCHNRSQCNVAIYRVRLGDQLGIHSRPSYEDLCLHGRKNVRWLLEGRWALSYLHLCNSQSRLREKELHFCQHPECADKRTDKRVEETQNRDVECIYKEYRPEEHYWYQKATSVISGNSYFF